MADHIDAVLDHVAIAVPDPAAAEDRWRGRLGGGRATMGSNPTFDSRQLRFANAAKLELLSPGDRDPSSDNFVRRFLDRFGSVVHHVTLKVPDLRESLDVLAAAGLEAVDVNEETDYWKEAFLRPSQVGGIVVQVASTSMTDQDWADFTGFDPQPPAPTAADLLGPALRHPDLERARKVWSVLGAHITDEQGTLRCRWRDSALDVVVEQGEPAGPYALRMRGAGSLPAQPGVGPEVIEAP